VPRRRLFAVEHRKVVEIGGRIGVLGAAVNFAPRQHAMLQLDRFCVTPLCSQPINIAFKSLNLLRSQSSLLRR